MPCKIWSHLQSTKKAHSKNSVVLKNWHANEWWMSMSFYNSDLENLNNDITISKLFYPFISCLHFLHQLFIPRWRQLILAALFTNELYILWQIPQALILIHSDALTLGMNPVVTLDTVHHLRIKVIIRVAFVTQGAEVVLFPLTPAVLAMCKFKHPQRFRILQKMLLRMMSILSG